MNNNDYPTAKQVIDEDINAILEAADAGEILPVDPDIADYMGAIEEDALDPDSAQESRFDHLEDDSNGQD